MREEGEVPVPAQGLPLQVLPHGAGLQGRRGHLQVQPPAPQGHDQEPPPQGIGLNPPPTPPPRRFILLI